MLRIALILVGLTCLEGISAQYGAAAVVPGIFIPTNMTNINNYGRNIGQGYAQQHQQYLPNNHNIPSNPANNNYGWVVPKNNNTVVGSQNSQNHDWTVGRRVPGDELLFKTLVVKNIGFFRTMAEKTIVFPDPNSKQRIREITSINVLDNSKKGTGGHTQIISGGIGKPSVELRHKSSNGKKIDLGVEIYGFK